MFFIGGFGLYYTIFFSSNTLHNPQVIKIFISSFSSDMVYILLGLFCLLKLFTNKTLMLKIVSVILVVISLIRDLTFVLSIGSFYGWRNIEFLFVDQRWRSLLPNVFLMILTVFLICVCVNLFKTFIGKKTSFILSAILFLLGLIISFSSIVLITSSSSRYVLNDFIVNKMRYICYLPLMYLALKPINKKDEIK